MLKQFTIFFLLISSCFSFPEQQVSLRIDSLKSALTKAKEDTIKVLLLNDLSISYYSINTDEGVFYGEHALELAEKLNWHSGIASAFKSLGVNYAIKAIYSKALEYFMKSLSIYTELGDKKNIAGVSNSLGLFYVEQNKEDEALKYFNKAILLNKELQNDSGLASNYLNLALLYKVKLLY